MKKKEKFKKVIEWKGLKKLEELIFSIIMVVVCFLGGYFKLFMIPIMFGVTFITIFIIISTDIKRKVHWEKIT